MAAQRRWIWISLGMAGIAAFVFGSAYYRAKQRPTPQPVETLAPPGPSFIALTGKIRARHMVPVGAPIDGRLEDVQVIDGQEVTEGQFLARIRNSTLELEEEEGKQEVERLQERLNSLESQLIGSRLEASRADADATRAQAEFTLAEKNYQRQKMLLAEGAVARQVFEKAEKDYQSLKSESEAVGEIARQGQTKIDITTKNIEEVRKMLAVRVQELDEAKTQLLATEVHAPVDGVLISHRAEAGAEVTHDMKNLFEIAVNLGELELVADAPAQHYDVVKPGRTAGIFIPEAGADPFPAVIRSVEGNQVILEFNSANPAAKPGLTAQARIELEPSTSQR